MRRELTVVGKIFFLLSLSFAMLVPTASSQSSNATIDVIAADDTGAAVVGAAVTVRNVDTNITRTGETGTNGRAQFGGLPVGPYEVTIQKAGFGKSVRSGIVLVLNQVAVISAVLKPAGVSETVTVTEDAPMLNTTTQEVGVRFDAKRITDLPTLPSLGAGFRDVFSFGLSAPGVSQINQGNTGFAGGTNYSVNGARLRSNNFTLDGQDVNDPSVTGVQQPLNNPDSVQEFRMITNQFSAEYGRAAGSVVNVVTKSGTNKVHGSAFWFHNDNTLNARSNLDKASQIGTGIDKQPLRIENQIGGTLGGPIVKDRTFFFGSIQRWTNRQLGSGATITGAPTAAGRAALTANGGTRPQVAALLNFLPQAQTSATGVVFYCLNGGPPSVQQSTNVAATSTCPTGGTLVTVPVGSITGANRIAFNNWQWSGKIDHQLSHSQFLTGRYLFNDQLSTGNGQATPTGLANVSPQRNQALTLGLTSTLTQRLLNEVRLSWNRAASATQPQDPTSLTIPSIEISNLGLNGFNAVGTRTAIGYGVNLPQSRRNNIYQLQDNLSWNKGAHSLKFGIDFRYQDLASDFNPNIRGQLRYSTLHTYVADVADLTAQINKPLPGGQIVIHYSWYDYFFYVQDSWKLNPNFTLNYGLRYELPGNAVDNLFPINDAIVAANGNNPLFRYNSRPGRDINNFQPRLGFNWNPQTSSDGVIGFLTGGNKTVLRGGYARTFDYAFLNMALNISSAFPFQAAFSSPGSPNSFANLATQTLSLGTGAACNTAAGTGTAPCLNQTMVAPTFRSPYADQYNLELQREIGTNNVLKLGYVATKGTALFQSVEGNPTTRCWTATTPIPALGCPRVDPLRGVERVRANTGSSIYHSMQVSLDHRFSAGLSGGVHYTWSSFIDDASEVFNPSTSGEVATAQDPFSKTGERARSTYDRPHRITGNVVYELPWHKSQAGVAGRVLGGWQVGSLMTFQSGSPFTVLNGADPAKALLGSLVGNAIRPNLNTTLDLSSMSLSEILAAGGSSLWSALPANGSVPTGNSPRNSLRSDGLISVDTSISKSTKIAEGHTLQFRADMFDMPNTRNFGIPNAAINSLGAFLNEKTTDGGNRRIFLSLRYSF
jgi:hypothetical protein